MQVSLEVELWVVDRDGSLVPPGPLTDGSEHVVEEFVEPMVELKTPPCESVAELRSTVVEQFRALVERADECDRRLVPLGTPVAAESIASRSSERSRIQEAVLGPNFEHATHCAGTHLHFEQRNVTDQLNALIAMDPASALVHSSPYYRGRRVAEGARCHVYRRRGYEQFPKHGQLWDYVETVAEWKRRLDRRYEEFEAAALAAGVDEATVREQFSADDVVWTPVRLRDAMPTVEWRAPDAALPSEVLGLAAASTELMERLHNGNVAVEGSNGGVVADGVRLPEFDALRDLVDAAIYRGLDAPAVEAYLRRLGFPVDDFDPLTSRVDRGPRVSNATAREIRLEAATLLERDVRELAGDDAGVPAGAAAAGRESPRTTRHR